MVHININYIYITVTQMDTLQLLFIHTHIYIYVWSSCLCTKESTFWKCFSSNRSNWHMWDFHVFIAPEQRPSGRCTGTTAADHSSGTKTEFNLLLSSTRQFWIRVIDVLCRRLVPCIEVSHRPQLSLDSDVKTIFRTGE